MGLAGAAPFHELHSRDGVVTVWAVVTLMHPFTYAVFVKEVPAFSHT
jgi:hypothetical protein